MSFFFFPTFFVGTRDLTISKDSSCFVAVVSVILLMLVEFNSLFTWGGKDIFAHTQQFTGDGDTLVGGERVIFAAWQKLTAKRTGVFLGPGTAAFLWNSKNDSKHPKLGHLSDQSQESEWDEQKQKNRATTWSLDASATVILKPGTIKVYFPDKARFQRCWKNGD